MTRQPHNFTEEDDSELLSFLREFCDFGANRAYIISAMARPKENETINHGSIPMFREIITHEEKIPQKFSRLKAMAEHYTPEEGGDLDFRLYITPNARDIEKCFYLFQKQLIEMQHNIATGHEETREKIKRLDKEWESTLQTDGNKDDNYFIIDIDKDDYEQYKETAAILENETTIHTALKTPNGFHIITDPFNFPETDGIAEGDIELKTDGLMFLKML